MRPVLGNSYYLVTQLRPLVALLAAVFLLQYGSSINSTSLDLAAGFPDALQGMMSHTNALGQFSTGNFQISAVPEPENYVLMLGGLGLVGWLTRRRQSV